MTLSIIIALVGTIGGFALGFRQGKTAERAYQLSLSQAIPRIGSRVEIDTYHPSQRMDVTRYAIRTIIYNDGNLVASHVEGEWKLTASHGIHNTVETIRADSLPSELPIKHEHKLVGQFQQIYGSTDINVQVDIDLSYEGIKGTKEKYSTSYKYDAASRSMLQVKK
jgi:hypothetical protein